MNLKNELNNKNNINKTLKQFINNKNKQKQQFSIRNQGHTNKILFKNNNLYI